MTLFGEDFPTLAKEMNLPINKLEELLIFSEPIVSLNSFPLEEDSEDITQFVQSSYQEPDNELIHKDFLEELNLSLKKVLSEREKSILEYRFGLNGKEAKTLKELEKIFNITRERVRQIEFNAKRKLRASPLMRKYYSWVK